MTGRLFPTRDSGLRHRDIGKRRLSRTVRPSLFPIAVLKEPCWLCLVVFAVALQPSTDRYFLNNLPLGFAR